VPVNPVLLHPHERRLSLDGAWGFRLDPEDRGLAEGLPARPELLAEQILVPGCWQGQGFGGEAKEQVRDFRLWARARPRSPTWNSPRRPCRP
jgi:beta-galactosidase/beta-glucuronidase